MNILFIDLHCDATMPSGVKEFGGGNTYSRGLLMGISKNKEINCLYITRKKISSLNDSEKISDNCYMERISIGGFGIDDKDIIHNYIDDAVISIKKIISKHNFTNFIIHSSYWHSGLAAIELCVFYNTRFVHTIQSNAKKKKIVSAAQLDLDYRIQSEEIVFNKAEYLICSCKAEKEEVHNLYNIPYDKLVLTVLPVDSHFIFPLRDKTGGHHQNSISSNSVDCYIPTYSYTVDSQELWWVSGPFLYFGRLSLDKGIYEIVLAWIDLWNEFQEKTPALWIAGGTPEQISDFRKTLIKRGVDIEFFEKKHMILWWGTLSSSNLSCLLSKSMVTVTHSKYESGGLMILESMACSTPIIATPYGYGKDYIKNWLNGFTIEYNDIQLLTYRMRHYVMQPFLAEVQGTNAKRIFSDINKRYNFMQKHIEIYNNRFNPDIISGSEDTLEYNYNFLPYQIIPSEGTIVTILKKLVSKDFYKSKERYTNTDSITWTFDGGEEKFRVDYWLTTINYEKLWIDDVNYLTTAKEKVNNIVRYSEINCFKSLEGHSIEDRITICRIDDAHTPSFDESYQILNQLFYTPITALQRLDSLSTQLTVTQRIINKHQAFLDKRTNILKFQQNLSEIIALNKDRNELTYGSTPIDIKLNCIKKDKLYGVTTLYECEWGYGVAKLCIAYELDCDQVIRFAQMMREYDKAYSILLWVCFLQFKKDLVDVLMNFQSTENDICEKFIKELKKYHSSTSYKQK